MTLDPIERDVLVRAPVDRVWTVITEPEHLGTWFGDAGAEVELREGGAVVLRWHEHGTFLGRIERLDPPTRIAIRWAEQADTEPSEGNSTLVEFTLTGEPDGTRVRVVESGFSDPKHREGNIEGWEHEFGHLVAHVEGLVKA
jgi:uncharacterized protein YndB with AHSA1/START domain